MIIGGSGLCLILIGLANVVSIFLSYHDEEVIQLGSWGPLLWSHIDVFGTLLLMIITYCMFCMIDKKIIASYAQMDGEDGEKVVERDFRYTFVNIDRPSLIAFVFLMIYFIVIVYMTKETMYLFFYGAIAFQMLFSSIIWANTEITDANSANTETPLS